MMANLQNWREKFDKLIKDNDGVINELYMKRFIEDLIKQKQIEAIESVEVGKETEWAYNRDEKTCLWCHKPLDSDVHIMECGAGGHDEAVKELEAKKKKLIKEIKDNE